MLLSTARNIRAGFLSWVRIREVSVKFISLYDKHKIVLFHNMDWNVDEYLNLEN